MVALALLASTGYVVVCARQARATVAEIKAVTLSQIRDIENMSTTYETIITCDGVDLKITTAGTITEHLDAVDAAKKECEDR